MGFLGVGLLIRKDYLTFLDSWEGDRLRGGMCCSHPSGNSRFAKGMSERTVRAARATDEAGPSLCSGLQLEDGAGAKTTARTEAGPSLRSG